MISRPSCDNEAYIAVQRGVPAENVGRSLQNKRMIITLVPKSLRSLSGKLKNKRPSQTEYLPLLLSEYRHEQNFLDPSSLRVSWSVGKLVVEQRGRPLIQKRIPQQWLEAANRPPFRVSTRKSSAPVGPCSSLRPGSLSVPK